MAERRIDPTGAQAYLDSLLEAPRYRRLYRRARRRIARRQRWAKLKDRLTNG